MRNVVEKKWLSDLVDDAQAALLYGKITIEIKRGVIERAVIERSVRPPNAQAS